MSVAVLDNASGSFACRIHYMEQIAGPLFPAFLVLLDETPVGSGVKCGVTRELTTKESALFIYRP